MIGIWEFLLMLGFSCQHLKFKLLACLFRRWYANISFLNSVSMQMSNDIPRCEELTYVMLQQKDTKSCHHRKCFWVFL